MEEMLSLFDYLGKPAGSELGKAVAKQAIKDKVKIGSRQVSTRKYIGTILLYPKSFLDIYFKYNSK